MGAALPIVSLVNDAQAKAGQANYQAQVARNSQIVAQRAAGRARQQGEVAAGQRQLATARIEGAQRAALASQGGDVNSGSPLDVVGDTARAGATDVATARSNAAHKAYGFELQADDAAGRASDFDFEAATALHDLPYAIGKSLLGTASSVATKFL